MNVLRNISVRRFMVQKTPCCPRMVFCVRGPGSKRSLQSRSNLGPSCRLRPQGIWGRSADAPTRSLHHRIGFRACYQIFRPVILKIVCRVSVLRWNRVASVDLAVITPEDLVSTAVAFSLDERVPSRIEERARPRASGRSHLGVLPPRLSNSRDLVSIGPILHKGTLAIIALFHPVRSG